MRFAYFSILLALSSPLSTSSNATDIPCPPPEIEDEAAPIEIFSIQKEVDPDGYDLYAIYVDSEYGGRTLETLVLRRFLDGALALAVPLSLTDNMEESKRSDFIISQSEDGALYNLLAVYSLPGALCPPDHIRRYVIQLPPNKSLEQPGHE